MMASHAQSSSRRPEIRRLAASIIADQAREIGEMQAMLAEMQPAAPADSARVDSAAAAR
jgi:uncharacterized protein (DUF305 family)